LQFNPSARICSDILGVSTDTIERNIKKKFNQTFTEYKIGKMEKTKLLLQQKAIQSALSGNNTMLIFCLKNLCGWADRPEDMETKDREITIIYNKN
jgi:hypothetical protein